ncbi:MAG: peptidylprolyl isomerase, partial [Actinomycetota bacterium]
MATSKRQRQKEGRAARLEAAQEQARKARTRRRILTFVLVVAAFLGVAFLISLFADDDEDDVATGDSTTTSTTVDSLLTPVPEGAAITGETPCPATDGSAERTSSFENPPPMCIDTEKTYTATVTTTKGEFTIELLDDQAPKTVNNFVVLSRYKFYEG